MADPPGELGAYTEKVPFNWAAAEELIASFEAAASALEDQVGIRQAAAHRCTAEWRGRYADQFSDNMVQAISDANILAENLRQAGLALSDLSELARREQQRRDDAKDWYDSKHDDSTAEDIGEALTWWEDEDAPPDLAAIIKPPSKQLFEGPPPRRSIEVAPS